MACHFQYVIPNHDGEDSENWDAFYYPIGDARKTLHAFVGLLRGPVPPGVEHWDENLLRRV
jgi:guanylate kinase